MDYKTLALYLSNFTTWKTDLVGVSKVCHPQGVGFGATPIIIKQKLTNKLVKWFVQVLWNNYKT